MPAFLSNWKTSLLGVGLLIVAIAHTVQSGTFDVAGFTAVLTALGLGAAGDAGKN